jgi:hypothetical protein
MLVDYAAIALTCTQLETGLNIQEVVIKKEIDLI